MQRRGPSSRRRIAACATWMASPQRSQAQRDAHPRWPWALARAPAAIVQEQCREAMNMTALAQQKSKSDAFNAFVTLWQETGGRQRLARYIPEHEARFQSRD